jgi:hypothetical protein
VKDKKMNYETWADGKLVKRETIPDPPPDPARVALDKAIGDTGKAATVADVKAAVVSALTALRDRMI